ncbi:MAG: hypothetical protein IPK97_18075 [Ahniella sp.]|nr:hypothetical protein [Ahniella sp.]
MDLRFGRNNLVNLNISKVNAAFDGATTREDFELDIDTNAGDDVVQLQFGDGTDSNSGWFQGGSAPVGNWYTNIAINAFRYVGGIARTNDRYADMQINVGSRCEQRRCRTLGLERCPCRSRFGRRRHLHR